MQPTSRTVLTHVQTPTGVGVAAQAVDNIRASDPIPVATFTELSAHVAEIAAMNHTWMTFYRGQAQDWRNRVHKTTILPTLFRPPRGATSLPASVRQQRFERLEQAVEALRRSWKGLRPPNPLWRFREYAVALLQHYGICPTPMIDLTTSLQVAASFARGDAGLDDGVVYVIAMPYPHQTISLYPDQSLSLARLQALVPRGARRPQYQEGWLAGRLPISAEKTAHDEAGGRLLAKYALAEGEAFWDGGFRPILQATLLPEDDTFGATLTAILADARWTPPTR
jgi:hypothetical protein